MMKGEPEDTSFLSEPPFAERWQKSVFTGMFPYITHFFTAEVYLKNHMESLKCHRQILYDWYCVHCAL